MSVRLSIENAEDRVYRGRAYAPSDAIVRYSTFVTPGGEISGFLRKKDGTLGVARVTERWYHEAAAPEWLKAVVDAERPEWARR